MKKRYILTIIFALLFIPLSFAQDAPLMTISPLGEAKFSFDVVNTGDEPDTFVLEPSDVAWTMRTDFTPDFTTGIDLNARANKSTTIYLKPNEKLTKGIYYVEIRIRSRATHEYTSKFFTVKIDPEYVDYKITIPVEISDSTSIDPSKVNSVKLTVKNPYPVYLRNISVTATSKFLNKEAIIDVLPKSEKIVDFSLKIDESTPKQEDALKISVMQGTREIANASETLYIREFKQPYEVKDSLDNKFLQKVHSITFVNTESSEKTRDASFPAPSTKAMIRTSPYAERQEFDGVQYLVWKDMTLKSGESETVVMVEDYRPLAALILVIVLVIAGYYLFRSPIIVRKKAYGIHKKDTGNNEIKVLVYLKNRTGRTIEKVRVLERLPIIHKVEPDFGPGTPEPKFRRGYDSIVLDWDIVLAPHEERIFSYKIKSALPIIGEHTLRPTVVQYGNKSKRISSLPYTVSLS